MPWVRIQYNLLSKWYSGSTKWVVLSPYCFVGRFMARRLVILSLWLADKKYMLDRRIEPRMLCADIVNVQWKDKTGRLRRNGA